MSRRKRKTPTSVNYDFRGKVAIVTGAARGVGRAIVHAFFEAGARVVAADRVEEGLLETCRVCAAGVVPVVADISTPEGAGAVVDAALDNFGRLDICVNNAAVAPHTALLEERVEVWDTVYAVNCRGTFLMTTASARAMIRKKTGGRSSTFPPGSVSAALRERPPTPRAERPRRVFRGSRRWSSLPMTFSSIPSARD
jgi:NAD(P)-dependent dehydrogenase (short-subunit alcohol dehydrogenase family)